MKKSGRRAASGGLDGNIRLWDLQSENPNVTVVILFGNVAVTDLMFSADGRWLVASGQNGSLRRWSLNLDLLKVYAISAVGRSLSESENTQYLIQ